METLRDTKSLPEKAFVDSAELEQEQESEESSSGFGLTKLQHIGIDLLIVAVTAVLLALLHFIEMRSIPLVGLVPYAAFAYSAILLIRAVYRSFRLAFQNAAGIVRRIRGVSYVQGDLPRH